MVIGLSTGSSRSFIQRMFRCHSTRAKRLQLSLQKLTVVFGFWFLFAPPDTQLCVFRNGNLKTSSVKLHEWRFFSSDKDGNLWLGDFYGGVSKIAIESIRHDDPANLKVEHFLNTNGLASNYATAMLADRDGNIWIGTGKGLQLLIDQPPVTFYSKASGLPTENIYAIVQDRAGAIWFGAWDYYLVRYANNVFTPEPQTLVQALFVDRDSRLWVGAAGGVYYRESDSSKWSSLYEQLKMAVADQIILVTVISQDRNGDIWFGGRQGIARYHAGQMKTFREADGLPGLEVTSVLQTSSGSILVGTNTDLVQLVDDKFVPLSGPNGGWRTFVRSLYEDHDGTLWIGTYDSGLFRYKNSQIVNINTAKGLFSDGVFCILEDDDGWFWINSNQGIYRVKRDELNKFADGQISSVNSVSYGPDDGLLNVEGNGGRQPAGLKAADGKFWFPTAGGLAVIDPRQATRHSSALPTLIEDVRVDQNEVEPQSGVITVEPGQSTVDIAYTAMSFVGSDRVSFRYRLRGPRCEMDRGRLASRGLLLSPALWAIHVSGHRCQCRRRLERFGRDDQAGGVDTFLPANLVLCSGWSRLVLGSRRILRLPDEAIARSERSARRFHAPSD